MLPNVISRDDSGGMTVRAVRVTLPIRIDGRLDETVYETLIPASDFIQLEPYPDVPATEKTDVWVLFDNENVYVALRCWETQPDPPLNPVGSPCDLADTRSGDRIEQLAQAARNLELGSDHEG